MTLYYGALLGGLGNGNVRRTNAQGNHVRSTRLSSRAVYYLHGHYYYDEFSPSWCVMIQRFNEKLPVCSYCLKPGHTAFKCGEKPRKTLNSYAGLKVSSSFGGQRKPMKARGKVTNQWIATRKKWVKLNPPSHQGYYTCHICNGQVLATEMELDHVISRSRAPELRYELSNLKPSHHTCNSAKGSTEL